MIFTIRLQLTRHRCYNAHQMCIRIDHDLKDKDVTSIPENIKCTPGLKVNKLIDYLVIACMSFVRIVCYLLFFVECVRRIYELKMQQ